MRAWLEKHPRFVLHFTPTSSSWLNLVERWFRELTKKRLRRGVFRSVPDLVAAIYAFIDAQQRGPQAVRLDGLRRGHRGQGQPLSSHS